jgi:hypothetical protein
MGFFSNVFKLTGKAELKEKIKNGAMLFDVREVEEYKSGHARVRSTFRCSFTD